MMVNPNPPNVKSLGFVSVVKAEQWWIEQARKNIAMYITYISDGQRKPAKHHLEWLANIFDPKCKNLLLIAPRESAKTSTIVDVMSYWIGHFPFFTNIISSVSSEQAQDRLSAVRDTIELPRYQNVFPYIHIDTKDPNNKSQFSVWASRLPGSEKDITRNIYKSYIASYGSKKDPTVHASGITSAMIIGRRFSGIALVDDPHDSNNSATLDQCLKVNKYFNENILGGMQATSKAIVITTRWAEMDLAGQLKILRRANGDPVWRTIDIPAINAQGESYWPEHWPLERLQAKLEDVQEIMFQTMYMNNPLGATTGMFQPWMLNKEIPEGVEFDKIVVSCDMARTKTANSDFTVALAVAKDKRKPFNYYILDGIRGKWDFHEGINAIAAFSGQIFERYNQLNGVVFEEPFDADKATEMRERYPGLPVITVHPKGDKGQRLGNVALKGQANNLFINQNMPCFQALKSELLGFPKAAHDDTCDAASLPLQLEMWSSTHSAGIKEIRSPFLL